MKNQNIPLLVLAVGLVVVSLALAFAPGEEKEQNNVQVSADSEQSVQPDKSEVYLKIVTMNRTAQVASNKNSEISNEVIAELKQIGEEDIETESYSLRREEDWNPRKEDREFKGYKVENVLKVTTSNFNNTGRIIDTAVNAGANGVERVQFSLTDEKKREIKSRVLDMAAKNAEEKANTLAQSLGVKTGEVISISESSNFHEPIYREESLSADREAGTSVMPGEVEVNAQVNVQYRIE